MTHFEKSIKQGELGECVVWNWLSKQDWCTNVVDLRKAKKFQDLDIDFLVFCQNKDARLVEVKTDYLAHLTNNIVYETSTSGNEGCFNKTQADLIAYYLPSSEQLYLLDVNRLKNLVKSHNFDKVKMGDKSEGYLITIKELKENQIILHKSEGVG